MHYRGRLWGGPLPFDGKNSATSSGASEFAIDFCDISKVFRTYSNG